MDKEVKRYKSVSLYNPETRKQKVVHIKRSDFETEEDLNTYCNALKAENRKKNAEWRRLNRQKVYAAKVAAVTIPSPESKLTTEMVLSPEINTAALHKHSSSVKLDLSSRTGSTIVIYGSSKRGKSTLMMHIYKKYFKSKDSINTLFSGNPHLKVYKNDKRLLIGYGFTDQHAKYVQMQQYINVKTDNHYKFVDLFDDIIDQKHAPIVNKLMLTYRNANISMIMCLQYVYLLSKQNRANVNHTFIFGMNSTEDQRGIIDLILAPYLVEIGITRMDDQIQWFREVTTDHGFIYLNNIKNEMLLGRLKLKK